MATTRPLLSLEDFERLPDDDFRHELDRGELVIVTAPKFRHGRIAQRINFALSKFVYERDLGEVYSEVAYLLAEDPPTLRIPDVSFLRAERAGSTPDDEYVRGAPDLAVEIISPSDHAEGVARKVRQYVAAGSRAVWTVYPKACEIHRFSPDATVRIVSTDALLEEPGLFPGWSLSLSELF